MFKPLNSRLLVRPDKVEEKVSAAGIIISTEKEERALTGIVLTGNTTVSSGQRVLFSAYGWDEATIDGETLYLVSESSLLGIF